MEFNYKRSMIYKAKDITYKKQMKTFSKSFNVIY